jgi:transcription elongation factor SPT6
LDEEEGGYEAHGHTLVGVMEPDELSKHDNEERKIIFNDVPERFQTRQIPVKNAEEDELKEEAVWIQKRAFETENNLISRQVFFIDL